MTGPETDRSAASPRGEPTGPINPYASPRDDSPEGAIQLRRLNKALVRGVLAYRDQMRREGVTVRQHLGSWLVIGMVLLWLVILLTLLAAWLGVWLPRPWR